MPKRGAAPLDPSQGCQRQLDDDDPDESVAGDMDDNVVARCPQEADGILRKTAGVNAGGRTGCRSPLWSSAPSNDVQSGTVDALGCSILVRRAR